MKLNEELELIKLGGEEAVQLYREGNIKFNYLKSVLICGYKVNEIKEAYELYLNSSLKSIVTFDELMEAARSLKVGIGTTEINRLLFKIN